MPSPRRERVAAVLATGLLGAALLAPGLGAAAPGGVKAGNGNPCRGASAARFLCPNLRIAAPYELYVDQTANGHSRLRATSNVRSRGRGPIEVHGTRTGPGTMKVSERIFKVDGGYKDFPTGAHLHFTDVGAGYGGSFWKFHNLASFQLWSVGAGGALKRVVRTGPKTNYCLRDLVRTQPSDRSPSSPHYPGCNQNPDRRTVHLGTSIGWSDIYPATYDKQWIDVTGLHGCFAFVMTVDPSNYLYEMSDADNSSRRLVRLPFRSDTGC